MRARLTWLLALAGVATACSSLRARLLEVAGADHVSILGRAELLAAMRALMQSRNATLVRPRAQVRRAA